MATTVVLTADEARDVRNALEDYLKLVGMAAEGVPSRRLLAILRKLENSK